ncbi:MAG: hypothetical protein EP298_11315 [Gammaproteobacteria bacterium]|nr:MAG: hypothetical protein EP298_11315 [Gammaproteobacteria bacterium]UTW43207.1 hypothetical protein KFE69_03420 [bacterium SCSIO 12844]
MDTIRYGVILSIFIFVFQIFLFTQSYSKTSTVLTVEALQKYQNSMHVLKDYHYCVSKNAQCGRLVKPGSSNIIECGTCNTGLSCVSNRCEAVCQSEQFAPPTDNLLLHMPIIINDDDLSLNDNWIKVTAIDSNDFVSRTDFSNKMIKVIFQNNQNSNQSSWFFRMIPFEKPGEKLTEETYSYTVMASKYITVLEGSNRLALTIISKKNKFYTLKASSTKLKSKSCNAVEILVTKDRIDLFVNNVKYTVYANKGDEFYTNLEELTIGPYTGKLWSIRMYDRLLTAEETKSLAARCLNSPSNSPYQEGYSNFLCGAYVCLWWPKDSDLEPNEQPIPLSQYQYYLKEQDEVFERNVLRSGMYLHGDVCGFMKWSNETAGRNLVLSYGIRRNFVKKFSESKPINQYWLHENFHSFQGQLKAYSGKRGNKFLLESTASWAPDAIIGGLPEAYDTLLGYYTLVPHLPLWSTQSSPIDESIDSRFKGGHQYGAFIFFAYITRYVLNDRFIGDVFNDTRAKSEPIAAVKDILAKSGNDLKQVFADFAAKTINYDYSFSDSYVKSELGSCKRMYKGDENYDPATCIQDSPKIIAYLDDNGTNGDWVEVPPQYKIGSWAYNTYEIDSPMSQNFDIGVSVDANNPAYTEMQARIVIHDLTNDTYKYIAFPAMRAGVEKTIQFNTPENSIVFLVVASTPDHFSGFDSYSYRYKVKKMNSI